MTGVAPGPGAIELRDIRKWYGPVRAVDGISLKVNSGEFLTLLGPSGCGKSTTLKLIGGFEQPDSGDILIAGRRLGSTPPHQRPVNTVFQAFALFPHMTVEQNIMFGLRMVGVPVAERQARVDAATVLVRLPIGDRRKPHQLSGGQQQRVALARALVNHPAVLLLDEPLGALDLQLRLEMQRELRHLNRRLETTFIYVTHDQDEALGMSDRIAVMNHGRILQVGTPDEIYERPRTRFVAGFVGQTNLFRGTMRGTRDGLGDVEIAGIGILRAILPAGTSPANGVTVSVAVRPEKVAIASKIGNAADKNTVSGIVTEFIYRGSHGQIVVETPGGVRVMAHISIAPGAGKAPSGGQPVELVFAGADATVLLDEGSDQTSGS